MQIREGHEPSPSSGVDRCWQISSGSPAACISSAVPSPPEAALVRGTAVAVGSGVFVEPRAALVTAHGHIAG
jgi:hypothetical protein